MILLCTVVIVGSLAESNPRQSVVERHSEILETELVVSQLPPLAQVKLLTQSLVTLATFKANKYWGGTRCTSIKYNYHLLPDSQIAAARWYSYKRSSAKYFQCSVTFNTNPQKVEISFYHYCGALIHEFGHLEGYHQIGGLDDGSHARNKRNIMYPVLSDANIPETCKARIFP